MTGFVLAGLFVIAVPANDEDAKLAAYFDSYLKEWLSLRPLDAIRLGAYEYAGEPSVPGDEEHAAYVELLKRTRRDLPRKVDQGKLSPSGRIDFQILDRDLERSIWVAENHRAFETDPRVYNEAIADAPYLLLTQCTLPIERRAQLCEQRIALVPRIVENAKRCLKNPPAVYVETAIKQNKGSISFYESGIFEVAGQTPQLSSLRSASQKAATVLKGYNEYLEKTLLPQAKGEWRLGKQRFARKLDLELDAGIGADELFREATAEHARVEREMWVMGRQLWGKLFPGVAAPPDDAQGRRELTARVLKELSKRHSTPETILKDATASAAGIKQFIASRRILTLPDPDRCRIIEMPEFQRGNSTAFLSPAPPLDPSASSIYAISPPPKDWSPERAITLLEEYNDYMLHILTIHEAYPGHYVQLEYSNRHPSKIRKVLYSGVFAEGWAVYTEQMMLDQGFGDGDPALRMHQLKFYLRAVVNAILDQRMHTMGMTDEQAMRLLVDSAFQSEAEARLKVIRSKQSPVQLSTYFAGRTAFYRLRNQTQRRLGVKFDLGKYHEAVLSHGTLPVKFLPALLAETLK
jgi:uncharacterized protein (DUF885 family)